MCNNIFMINYLIILYRSSTEEEPTTTTQDSDITTDPFAIDIRFSNKSITRRSTKEVEEQTKPNIPDNSLHPLGFWSFPVHHIDSPNRLATCVHKKFECVPIAKCKPTNTDSNLKFCRFSRTTPYVCCEKQSNRLAQRQDTICGRKKSNGRSAAIIGGTNVQNGNAFPWMAAIGQIDKNGDVDWFCGGALIGVQTVVTAAHCLGRR